MGLRWKAKIDERTTMTPTGRDTFEYREGGRTMRVVAELMSGKPERLIYATGVLRWNAPHDGEEIDQERREEILSRIKRYFEINDVSYEVK